jgi:diguanylate cyclase (GGDEF)-like protein
VIVLQDNTDQSATLGPAQPENASADKKVIPEKNIEGGGEEPLFYTPLSLDLVSAFAGDRPLTDHEKELVDSMQKDRDGKFYSDLLYAVTHRFFSPSVAEDLWNRILRHKYEMSSIMKRNIRIAVASLDYLSNLTSELPSPTVSDERFIADLIHLSVHDGLTGLFNHSSCFQRADVELKRYVRYKTPVSFLMMDIDNFKEINDRFGHQAGDSVLLALGTIIREEAREPDICCRYGGDEFTVIMPLTDADEAVILAERLKARITQSKFDGKMLTVSIGVASCGENIRTSVELVQKADNALYEAKRKGKDRIVVAREPG